MNPLLRRKFDHLESQLAALAEVLEANRADVVQQHEEKENLLQEQWRQRKHMTTLSHIAGDYDALDEQNKRYAQERQAMRERLEELLKVAKALRAEYTE